MGHRPRTAEQARANQDERPIPIDIDVFREWHGVVPPKTTFASFVVWIRERDEFLVRLKDLADRIELGYGAALDKAVKFRTWENAAPHAKASKYSASAVAALDLGQQVIVIWP